MKFDGTNTGSENLITSSPSVVTSLTETVALDLAFLSTFDTTITFPSTVTDV